MRTLVLVLGLLISGLTLQHPTTALRAQSRPSGSLGSAVLSRPTEQQWIVSEVTARIASIASSDGQQAIVRVVPSTDRAQLDRVFTVTTSSSSPFEVVVSDHLWSPETFRPFAEHLFRQSRTAVQPAVATDHNARLALVDLTVDTLLNEDDRISALLDANMRSADAHEAAALIVGAFAMRESAGSLTDVRPALNRMAAHLAVARALRPAAQEGKDGMLAHAILTVLAGLQRQANAIVDMYQPRVSGEADRRWTRALRLRIAGDWRGAAPTTSDSLLERFEHARALRLRLTIDEFLAYHDKFPDDPSADWARIATYFALNAEGEELFTPANVVAELADSVRAWSRRHPGQPVDETVIRDLNELPQAAIRQDGRVHVLDWGTWAAHQQRHLVWALIWAPQRSNVARYEEVFGELYLFPVLLKWIASDSDEYEYAVSGARSLVERNPELLTQDVWTQFLRKPSFAPASPFPLDVSWFTPHVPVGTAFDISNRSLRSGINPRPAALAQTARWAVDRPYDFWTQWAREWAPVEGKPELAAVRKAMSPFYAYDKDAIRHMVDYMTMPDVERITLTKAMCDLVTSECSRLGELMLLMNRETEAADAYNRWERDARDREAVSEGVMWLVRYEQRRGNSARAEAIARRAATTGTYRGRQELGEWFDRNGRHAEAERTYRELAENVGGGDTALGVFLMRESKRTSNPELQLEAADLLQLDFPGGLEPLVKYNLSPGPQDGVAFATFGLRPMGLGMQFPDVIVSLNGWRVRTALQFSLVSRFTHDDMMAMTVWRDGRYQDIRIRVPERSFGARLKDHRGRPPGRLVPAR